MFNGQIKPRIKNQEMLNEIPNCRKQSTFHNQITNYYLQITINLITNN